MMVVLASYCCCNKFLHTDGLNQHKCIQCILLQFCRSEIQNETYRTKTEVSTDWLLSEAPGRIHIIAFFSI